MARTLRQAAPGGPVGQPVPISLPGTASHIGVRFMVARSRCRRWRRRRGCRYRQLAVNADGREVAQIFNLLCRRFVIGKPSESARSGLLLRTNNLQSIGSLRICCTAAYTSELPLCPRRHRAFTLIELMVVVALIGILSAMIIPEMRGTYEDALLRSSSRQLVNV